ncbi:ankyrin repeat domain-containing protein [Pseudotabrizicola sp. 4114]|uniref:ankyrin repeat domain-containing protein n=1 Tax=Pseudotabrizicola sp. 4114 TaxID=2817731 RepID=UPI002856241C|nr:ankyrin repeat protein [Pseudorhodobacter sp. 4114]
MRKLLYFVATLLMGASGTAAAEPSADEVAAFHALVETGKASEVQAALRQYPALASAKGQFGFEAIHLLDYIDFEEKLLLLLQYGADIAAKNDDGHTLLHILIDPEFLPVVLREGGQLEIRDGEGRTPLMLALAEADNHDMIEALLTAGADPDTRNDQGQSALAYAKAYGDQATVDLLTQAGASR